MRDMLFHANGNNSAFWSISLEFLEAVADAAGRCRGIIVQEPYSRLFSFFRGPERKDSDFATGNKGFTVALIQ